MSTADEARAELVAVIRGASNPDGRVVLRYEDAAEAILAAGYRKPEAAPSDTDHAQHREAEEYVAGCPVCEANEELRLRMNAETARSRTSQPVQVEVTDDMVEKAAKAIWEVRHVVTDDEWWERTDHGPYLREARAALSAALGGGE